jgi:hypothetical protein
MTAEATSTPAICHTMGNGMSSGAALTSLTRGTKATCQPKGRMRSQ